MNKICAMRYTPSDSRIGFSMGKTLWNSYRQNEYKSHIVWLCRVRFGSWYTGTICWIKTKNPGLRLVKKKTGHTYTYSRAWLVTLWINCEGWSRIYDASQMTINAQGLNCVYFQFQCTTSPTSERSSLQGYYIWCILWENVIESTVSQCWKRSQSFAVKSNVRTTNKFDTESHKSEQEFLLLEWSH